MTNPLQVGDDIKNAILKREAVIQARWRMFGKLVAVLAVLLAYTFLRGMEGAKRSYDEEHGRPVVIVRDPYALENIDKDTNVKTAEATAELGSRSCPALYPTPTPSPGASPQPVQTVKKIRPDAIVLRVCAVQGFFDEGPHERALKETVEKKLMYQNFKDDKAIIARLDEEILADAEFQKKALLSTEDLESRRGANKLPDLSQDKVAVEAALKNLALKGGFRSRLPQEATEPEKEKDFEKWANDNWSNLPDSEKESRPTDKQIDGWRQSLAFARSGKNPSSPDLRSLIRWRHELIVRTDDSARLGFLKEKIADVDHKAQEKINAVYVKLKPNLRNLINVSPGALRNNDSVLAYFNPRAVLDERSGIHVIYQTLRLAFVMVLVFGVIFVLILMLRPLPFFSKGTDQLMDHASELFKRSDGAGPQLAKSLAVTAAALGVGAAVAVAGSNAGSPKSRVAGDYYPYVSEQDEDGQRGWGARPGKPGLPGSAGQAGAAGTAGAAGQPGAAGEPGGGIDLHEVKLLEPIWISGGPSSVTLDPISFKLLSEARVPQPLTTSTTGLTGPDIDRRISLAVSEQVAAKFGTVDLQDLNKRTKALDDLNLSRRLIGLETWQTDVGSKFATNLGLLRDEVAATKTAVQDIRDSSYERQQNSGGRSFWTRATQGFKSNNHLITSQSFKALSSLMRRLPTACPTAADADRKCCNGATAKYAYCDAQAEAILTRLSNMIGSPPMDESEFMRSLRASGTRGDQVDQAIDRWKPVILRYTRTAY